MLDENIKVPLIQQKTQQTSPSPNLFQHKSQLKPIQNHDHNMYIGMASLGYKSNLKIEGQCILKTIIPIKKNPIQLSIYLLISIMFLGVPQLLIFWYPKLKKKIYYSQSSLAKATHFYIINHDDEPTYPLKQQQNHYFNKQNCQNLYFFINRYLKYIIINNQVHPSAYDFFNEYLTIDKNQTGLTKDQSKQIRKSYGIGAMVIQSKSIFMLFVTQIMRPLYVFIILSCLLWVYEQYYYYMIMIFVSAVGGVVTSLFQTYQLNKKIHNMAYYETKVNILREGNIIKTTSKSIVPGDIVFLKQSIKIPFDGLLLQSSALCNQCSITGQSVPVLKKSQTVYKEENLKNSFLYEGSMLIQVNNKLKFQSKFSHLDRFRQQYGLPVMVIRTNFITLKGQLIRIISFPTVRSNTFQKQSVKFLISIFIFSLISYSILAIKLWEYTDTLDFFVKLGDLITVTVPPGLPISMTFGIVFALQKMKKKHIFCTSPNKIIAGGMTNIICFDKTGTLTQDFMDFYCLVPICHEQTVFQVPIFANQQSHNISTFKKSNIVPALTNMATNHNIVKLQDTGAYVGDPMEIKMMQFGNFTLSPIIYDQQHHFHQDVTSAKQIFSSERGHNGQIIKNFEFSSQLFRMSTIARSNLTGQDFYLYSKGSPQQMFHIFNPKTIPQNYHQMLKQYTARGYRVLAIGSRQIQKQDLQAQRLQLEQNLHFDGFEVFENKLKKQTQKAISQLNKAQIPCVMITGDNALTACSIAYKCCISQEEKITFICTYQNDKKMYKLQRFRDDYHKNATQTQSYLVKQIENILTKVQQQGAQLCITGQAMNQIYNQNFEQWDQTSKNLFWKIKVFARAKPNDKTKIITIYQHFDKIVAMCGDGANDCGALKQSNIGLSLSEAEASVSAPFTSKITNISSMVQLIKECQAGLATNFSIFNIMALYSLTQYSTVIICQFFFAFPSDFSYLYWDFADNFLFFLAFGYTGTTKVLSKYQPSKSLFSVSNITSVLVAFFIQLIGQFLMIYALTSIYADEIGYYPTITFQQFIENGKQFVNDSYQGNLLFLFSNFIYISTILAFSISKPWREEFYKNPLLMIVFITVSLYSILICVWQQARLSLFEIVHMNYQPFNNFVCYTGIGFAILIFIVQKYMLEPFFFKLKEKYPQKTHI